MARIRKHRLDKAVLRKQKKKKTLSKEAWITIFIGGIMILSVFGILFSSYNDAEQNIEYNGHDFYKAGDLWITKIDGERMGFMSHPEEVESLEIPQQVIYELKGPVYITTFDPDSENIEQIEGARFTFAVGMTEKFGKGVIPGMSNNNTVEYDLPVYTCMNSTQFLPVIYFKSTENATNVHLDGTCIIFESRSNEWNLLLERVLYGMLGII